VYQEVYLFPLRLLSCAHILYSAEFLYISNSSYLSHLNL